MGPHTTSLPVTGQDLLCLCVNNPMFIGNYEVRCWVIRSTSSFQLALLLVWLGLCTEGSNPTPLVGPTGWSWVRRFATLEETGVALCPSSSYFIPFLHGVNDWGLWLLQITVMPMIPRSSILYPQTTWPLNYFKSSHHRGAPVAHWVECVPLRSSTYRSDPALIPVVLAAWPPSSYLPV